MLRLLAKSFLTFLFFVLFFSLQADAGSKKVIIETPDPCVKVENVDGKSIYLKSTAKNCIQTLSKVQIEIDSSVQSVYVFLDGTFWKEQKAKEFDLDDIREYMERGKKEFIVPENTYKEQGGNIAEQTYKRFRSEEFQNKLQEEIEKLKSGILRKPVEEYYKDRKREKAEAKLKQTERLYIFVSSSIPLETIRSYVRDASKVEDPNIVFVLRGFVGGMRYIKPTMNFIAKAILKNEDCDFRQNKCESYNVGFEIDPVLFRRYGIDKVPAVVYVPHIETTDAGMSAGIAENTTADNAKASAYHMVSGDASLEYILDIFLKETKSKSIEDLITALRKGFY